MTVDYVNISGFNVIGATGVEKAGFYLNGRQHCNILDNIADSNRVGIDLSSSSNNTLMCNTADSNDYGTDLDGIGDDPHPIPGGTSIDRFPLMQPWDATTPQIGDLNRDGQITPADAAIVLTTATAGGPASCDPTTLAAVEVSGDNRITSLDALMILQAAAGAIEL